MTVAAELYESYRRSIAAKGYVVRASLDSVEADDPSISSGSAAPSAAEPNGSIYLRTGGAADTTFYMRVSGAWVAVEGTGAGLAADTISEVTAGAGVTVDGLLLKDGKVDLNGIAGALILDADADTYIGASTDDEIDVTVAGAADFKILANILRALSGSSIETNTINETTAASGVTIDGALIKDAHILDSVGFYDAAAPTKIVRLDAGNVVAGNTRVLTMPDADVTISAFAATFLDDASEAVLKATLNMEAGVDFQAYDATLQSLSALGTAADKGLYTTGVDTWAEFSLTSAGRAILDDADATAQRVTLGVVIGTNVQAYDATLQSLSALGTAADKLAYTTGIDTWAEATLTTFARSILDDVDEATFKATVNLEIGTDVQAYDAELAAIAGLVSAADKAPYFTGSGTAALMDVTAAARSILDDASVGAIRTTLGVGTADNPSFAGVVLTGNITTPDSNTVDPDFLVLRAFVSITAAQIRALDATPIQLVAAPGATKFLEIVSAHFWLDFTAVAHDDAAADGNLAVKYTDGAGEEVARTEADGLIDAGADAHRIAYAFSGTDAVTDLVPVANAALVLHNDGAAFTGTGDSPLKVEVFYRVRTLEPA